MYLYIYIIMYLYIYIYIYIYVYMRVYHDQIHVFYATGIYLHYAWDLVVSL